MIEFGGENKEINEKSKTAPFLLSLEDTMDNVLRVVIALPVEGEEGENLDNFPEPCKSKVDDLLIHSRPVHEDMERVYEIAFHDYVLYQNRNESYTVWDDYEIRKGNYLIIFEKSRLLDFYEDVLFDFDDEETKRDKRKHYGIYTENHILDVISNSEPKIRKISGRGKDTRVSEL